LVFQGQVSSRCIIFLQNLYDTVTRANENKKERSKRKGKKSTQEGTMLSLNTAVQTLLFDTFVVVETFQVLLRLLNRKF